MARSYRIWLRVRITEQGWSTGEGYDLKHSENLSEVKALHHICKLGLEDSPPPP